jgi:Second Messenger Oligonucleotide or Dinucleotide Synthetase domain
MNIESAFDDFQTEVNAPQLAVDKARTRRNLFRGAFDGDVGVLERLPSGSLARGSQKDPIHDVDMIIVFDEEAFPEWGSPGSSAEDSLRYTQGRVRALLGESEGTFANEVRRADVRNHSVKCWLDDPEVKGAFTVDVTPALRRGDELLLIPERHSQKWIETAPEYLMRVVKDRHADWNKFVPLVRVLKRWASDQSTEMESLVLEVLALDHLPNEDRPKALARFFTAATTAVLLPVVDPAQVCGEIQPDLDRQAASAAFARAAEGAWRAVEADASGDAERAACLWRTVFGSIFPEPPGGCGNGGAGALAGAAAVTVPRRPRPVQEAPQG